ncbi:MAG: glycosyltransferase family 2 protein [Promethearchaeota archaeon]
MNTTPISVEKSNLKNYNLNNSDKKVNYRELHKISVIIPLFNEENTIKNVIERIPNHHQCEVILVDDGSTDKSVERVKEIENMDIKIVKHKENQGYGAAVITGMKHATGDIIITLDSDGQHNPEEIANLIKPIIDDKADLVVGSRYLGQCNYKMPLYAKVGGYFIHIFLKLLFLQEIYDNQCGFRAFRKDIKTVLRKMRYTDMGFSTELLFKVAFHNFRIIEIPISVDPRTYGTSYVNLIKIIRSISSCIIYYILKKFRLDINNLILKKIIDYFYRKIKNKKIFS